MRAKARGGSIRFGEREAAPVLSVVGYWRIGIGADHRAQVRTGDWHLLHSLTEGQYELTVNGVYMPARAGDLIYYPPYAQVEWLRNPAPVVFYSLAFELQELGLGTQPRHVHTEQALAAELAALVRDWLEPADREATAPLRRWARLCELVGRFFATDAPADATLDPSLGARWRRLESHLRHSGDWHMSTDQMARWMGCSRSTLHRACLEATGQAPAARLRALRHDLARQLLTSTAYTVTAIAERLGYGRLPEFSREFRRYAGMTPSQYRSSGGRSA